MTPSATADIPPSYVDLDIKTDPPRVGKIRQAIRMERQPEHVK